MVGGDHERGRGPERRRGRGRGRSHESGRGSGYYQPQPRRSSSQDGGSSSSSSSRDRGRDDWRLAAEYAPPPPNYGNIPIRIGKQKAKPPPKEYEDYADAVGYQSSDKKSPSPVSSKQISRTPSPSLSSAGEICPEQFPTLQKSHERSRGSKSALAGDVSPLHTEQNTPPPPDDSQNQAPPPDEDTALKEKFRELLNNCGRSAEGAVSYYQALGEFSSRLKRETLKVKFDHLLNEEYINLALKIKEKSALDKEHMWLQSIASEFLRIMGFIWKHKLVQDQLGSVVAAAAASSSTRLVGKKHTLRPQVLFLKDYILRKVFRKDGPSLGGEFDPLPQCAHGHVRGLAMSMRTSANYATIWMKTLMRTIWMIMLIWMKMPMKTSSMKKMKTPRTDAPACVLTLADSCKCIGLYAFFGWPVLTTTCNLSLASQLISR